MKNFLDKILKHKTFIDVMVILLITILLFIPMFRNANVYYDDGIQHIARAYGTYISFGQNGLFNKIINNFSNNFGYSWDYFYGAFTTYGIIFFYFIVKNFILAYKLFCFAMMFLSGIFMYKFLKRVTDNRYIGLLTGILYMTFPYHLTDLYYRNALGEFTAFVFIPLVFLGIFNLVNVKKGNYYLAIGAIGLIFTHNLSVVMVAIFALFYFLFHIEKVNTPEVKKGLLKNILFIVLITACFWIPLIETKVQTPYHVYTDGGMSTSESMAERGLTIMQLFATAKNNYVFELGPHFIIMLALTIMAHRKIDKKYKNLYISSIMSAIVCLFLSTKYFPWKYLPNSFSIFQFPWRFLMMAGFFISIVSVLNIYSIVKKFGKYDVTIISLLSIIYICAFCNSIPMTETLNNIEDEDLGHISGKELECVAGLGKEEYLPQDSYDNRFYIATREDKIYTLEGSALIENEEKNGSDYTAHITTYDCDFVFLELPYIYYPGYKVTLDGMVSKVYETKNGMCGVVMPAEDDADLHFYYSGSILTKISYLISLVSLIAFIVFVVKQKKFFKEAEKKVRTIKLVNNVKEIENLEKNEKESIK